jgi:hypothetical protein
VNHDDTKFARGDEFRLFHANAPCLITGSERRRLRQHPPARHAAQGEQAGYQQKRHQHEGDLYERPQRLKEFQPSALGVEVAQPQPL